MGQNWNCMDCKDSMLHHYGVNYVIKLLQWPKSLCNNATLYLCKFFTQPRPYNYVLILNIQRKLIVKIKRLVYGSFVNYFCMQNKK